MNTSQSFAAWIASTSVAALAALAGPCAHAQTPAPAAPATATAQAGTAAPMTRAQSLFGDVNPKLAQLTDDVLFGDVWARPGLSQRDRSLVTVSALIALNRPDQLRSHLQRARDNGLTEAELIEAMTHLAFYTGWPNAITASLVAKEVFKKK
jgi:4-carboxymuconolactone decarboxylase